MELEWDENKSNLAKLDAMIEADIDYSDIPDLGDAEELWAKTWVKRAEEPFFPVIPIDPEVVSALSRLKCYKESSQIVKLNGAGVLPCLSK